MNDQHVHDLQDRIADAFLSTLRDLSPLPAEDFGSLVKSTLPRHLADGLLSALSTAGWITITRNGNPVANGPVAGDLITFSTPTPSIAALRTQLQ